jgi:FkbH-like protein
LVPDRSAQARLETLLEEAARTEVPDPALCVKLARAAGALGDPSMAYAWLVRSADSRGPFQDWSAAAVVLAKLERHTRPQARRSVRVALVGSYTTSQYGALLRLTALRRGVHVELYEAGFNVYMQEILAPSSGLYEFDPDYVVIAPHEGAVGFPFLARDPEGLLEAESRRWKGLWDAVATHSRARVIQHNFVVRPDTAWGNASATVPGSRDEMLRALNTRLAATADENVLVVDCDRIAGAFGKARWFDDRYWHVAKQAVALDALPDLARHTAALLAAAEGLTHKCAVLDLDNTLWGGVIAEDGLAGIQLGNGPRGEAYVAFQEYLLALRERGVLLAVVSKNNDRDAREPFEHHPDMRLRLADISLFLANWDDKAANVGRVAERLNIGLDSIVFIDDNPAERQVVRQLLPAVEVVQLPSEASGYVRAVSDTLLFEAAAVSSEDLSRAVQYQARAAAAELEQQAGSLEEFYASLDMQALVAPFDELNLGRIVQLIGKTNQFNVTTRRHGMADVRRFMNDGRYVTLYLRLRDRFADHGLVALLIAEQKDDVLEIDTWLMSCRVIGRTLEDEMFRSLCEIARERKCACLRGTFIPTDKNGVVTGLFDRLGFAPTGSTGEGSTWTYDLGGKAVPEGGYIRVLAHPVQSPG